MPQHQQSAVTEKGKVFNSAKAFCRQLQCHCMKFKTILNSQKSMFSTEIHNFLMALFFFHSWSFVLMLWSFVMMYISNIAMWCGFSITWWGSVLTLCEVVVYVTRFHGYVFCSHRDVLSSSCDVVRLRICGEVLSLRGYHMTRHGHAMICRRGGFIIQRHNEVRDLETEMLNMVCYDIEVEPVLQEITGRSCSEVSIKRLTLAWIFTHVGFGIDKVLTFSTWGYVTPTQNHIETLAQSKYIANMKMERSTHTQRE